MKNEERVRQRAYEIWEQAGRPEGRETEHWQQAVEEITVEEEGSLSIAGEEDPEPVVAPPAVKNVDGATQDQPRTD